jgi:hypothetical protein
LQTRYACLNAAVSCSILVAPTPAQLRRRPLLLPAPVSLPGYLWIGWRGNRPSRATVLGLKNINKLPTDKVNDSLMVNRCQVCRSDRPNLPRRVIDVSASQAGGISPAALRITRSRRSASVAPRRGRGATEPGAREDFPPEQQWRPATVFGFRPAAPGEALSSARSSPPAAVHRSS